MKAAKGRHVGDTMRGAAHRITFMHPSNAKNTERDMKERTRCSSQKLTLGED